MKFYRIAKWRTTFECSNTHRVQRMHWCRFPLEAESSGLSCLQDMDAATGMAYYGVFCALLRIAANGTPRGVFRRQNGTPHTSKSLARAIGTDEELVAPAIEALISVRWIEEVTEEQIAEDEAAWEAHRSKTGKKSVAKQPLVVLETTVEQPAVDPKTTAAPPLVVLETTGKPPTVDPGTTVAQPSVVSETIPEQPAVVSETISKPPPVVASYKRREEKRREEERQSLSPAGAGARARARGPDERQPGQAPSSEAAPDVGDWLDGPDDPPEPREGGAERPKVYSPEMIPPAMISAVTGRYGPLAKKRGWEPVRRVTGQTRRLLWQALQDLDWDLDLLLEALGGIDTDFMGRKTGHRTLDYALGKASDILNGFGRDNPPQATGTSHRRGRHLAPDGRRLTARERVERELAEQATPTIRDAEIVR